MTLFSSNENIVASVSLCMNNKRFIVLIACESCYNLNYIGNIIREYVDDKDVVVRVTCNSSSYCFTFKNGSYICVTVVDGIAIGIRANIILYNPWINQELLNSVVLPCLRKYVPQE